MTTTAEEKAFLSVAIAAIPRVAEIILELVRWRRLSGASWLRHWTMAAPG
jgi:hypothetical protein